MAQKIMSEEKLQYFEALLKKEKEDTLNLINKINDKMRDGSKDSSGDSSSYTLHQADLGTDTSNWEREVYILEEQQKKLKKINQALHRIYDKTYGICEISGELISEGRLNAVPWSRYCVKAKEEEEKRQKTRRR
jgi:RNA polymerase-binding protein DksA